MRSADNLFFNQGFAAGKASERISLKVKFLGVHRLMRSADSLFSIKALPQAKLPWVHRLMRSADNLYILSGASSPTRNRPTLIAVLAASVSASLAFLTVMSSSIILLS